MKVLIVGCNGQVGWELCRQADQLGVPFFKADLPQFDITDSQQVAGLIKTSEIALVINAAAYTAVDKAESEAAIAYAVNRDGPDNLAAACTSKRIPLIHISTDYVFDGTKNGAYLETDPLVPLGVYGKSKAAGEEIVRQRCAEHLIIRTAWVYGVHGHNFVKTMLKLGKTNKTIRVVNDQQGGPTFAADIAETILSLADTIIKKGEVRWGTFHYCGKPATTWYEFAREIFRYGRSKTPLEVCEVIPIKTEDYPTPARRPPNSVLDCQLIEKAYNIQIYDWQDRLHLMLDRLLV